MSTPRSPAAASQPLPEGAETGARRPSQHAGSGLLAGTRSAQPGGRACPVPERSSPVGKAASDWLSNQQAARSREAFGLCFERFEIVILDDEFASAFSHEALQCIHRPRVVPSRAEPLGELPGSEQEEPAGAPDDRVPTPWIGRSGSRSRRRSAGCSRRQEGRRLPDRPARPARSTTAPSVTLPQQADEERMAGVDLFQAQPDGPLVLGIFLKDPPTAGRPRRPKRRPSTSVPSTWGRRRARGYRARDAMSRKVDEMNTRAALGEGAGMCVSGAGLRRSSLSKNVTAMLSGRATGGAASEHSAIHAETRLRSGRNQAVSPTIESWILERPPQSLLLSPLRGLHAAVRCMSGFCRQPVLRRATRPKPDPSRLR